jgi:putative transposase
MPVLAYCLMPNHFHLVVWPRRDGELSRWMHWLEQVHQSMTEAELAALRHSVFRGAPYSKADWVGQTAKRLSTLRPRGRPPQRPAVAGL